MKATLATAQRMDGERGSRAQFRSDGEEGVALRGSEEEPREAKAGSAVGH